MNVFIVHAHPEPQSFNGALTRHAQKVLTAQGHQVVVSDLHAMGWDPVSDRRNFVTRKDPTFFKQQQEELHAGAHDGFAPEIKAELDKLLRCDVLIFQFPIWWFSLPAILKGWVDRVFAMGTIYGGGRWFDTGVLRGKRAMLSLTTGGGEPQFSEDGLFGSLEQLLLPIHHGIFRFTGLDVLPPFVAWSVAHVGEEARARYLEAYGQRLVSLETTELLRFPSFSEFEPKTLTRKRA
ncbi:NAD(P)H oxidoreductase YRKL [Cystobacter fuscus]|uniref:NAD(P)H oxidoreductase YRKL n=1 Tax=Cystobacter fuscus TaxID=43 RepID=A0A250JHZ6_9BACT|nr:NAD(P)H-dependent oxidoreductase [Cystobacter fuscus]ATB43107.1 NAD(P)H oxidoreductase YRKL [Cystobacter fuscus]